MPEKGTKKEEMLIKNIRDAIKFFIEIGPVHNNIGEN